MVDGPDGPGGWCTGRKNPWYTSRWCPHASHNLAKLPFDLHVTIERAALRPQYRDGFAGAPLKLERLPDRQVQIRGADGTARPEPVGSCGPGELRDHPAE